MQIVAHPDDEDGGMLTLQARGHGVSTLLMTLNRGEGGQNKIGSNLSDVLGVLRAEELLASDEYYGVQERFCIGPDHRNLPHVGNIENSCRLSHRQMLLHNARVINRHFPPSKLDQLPSQFLVCGE